MYRVPAATCALLLSAAAAHASSIQTLPETSGGTPSIIAIGSEEPPTLEGVPMGSDTAEDGETPRYQVGGSILAFGVEAIPAAPVAVASIDPVAEEKADAKADAPGHAEIPFVIRGGVVGNAFAAPPAEEVELPDETAAGEPSEPVEPAEPVEPQG